MHWQDLFPMLASGDTQSRSVIEGARLLEIDANQPVFHAVSPCEN